jgi:hypothetical protein
LRAALDLSNPLRPLEPLPAGLDPAAVARCAHQLGTAEAVTHGLTALGHGDALDPGDQSLYLENLARNMLLLEAAQGVCHELQAYGLTPMPIKGYAFLQDLYGDNVGVRRMFDLDLMIDADTFSQALPAMEAQGWRRVLDAPVIQRLNVEALFVRPDMPLLRLELHRALTFPGRYRLHPRDIWARSRNKPGAPLAGARRMDPVDTLLYLALHKAQHGWRNDCRDMVDATNLVERHALDWGALTARARGWGCGGATWLFLLRCRRAFGLPAPPQVLEALRPGDLRARLLQALPDATTALDFRQRRNNQRPLPRKVAASLLLSDARAQELAALGAIALRGAADLVARRAHLADKWLAPLERVPMGGPH